MTLSERLEAILKALEDMAAGELDCRAPISADHDEIDAIAYTVNVLVGELHFTLNRLARAERESQRANQQKNLFLRSVSHELRTPLAAVLSYTDLLAGTSLDEKQAHAVERIRANGNALHHLIEDLLDVARIEAGKLQLALAPVSPIEVAKDVVQSLLIEADSKGLAFKLWIASDVPGQIVTDARRLRQILMNLLGNAVKFSDHGEVVVSLETNAGDGKLIIDVADTGIGLSDAEQQHLFSAFMQSDTSRGGVGIGLVLARQLCEELGGRLDLVSSRLSEGSRFRVQLPIDPGSRLSVPSLPSVPKERDAADLEGLSVLIADDNPDLLSSLASLLEVFGCIVEKVSDGLMVLERVCSKHFDVILMDMQMPRLDGLETTRRLRKTGFKGAIFAVSAHAMSEDRGRCLDAGCTDHIAKPIDLDQLVANLAAHRPLPLPGGVREKNADT